MPRGRIVEIYNPTIPYEMRRWHLCIEHTVQTVASVDGVTGTHKGKVGATMVSAVPCTSPFHVIRTRCARRCSPRAPGSG